MSASAGVPVGQLAPDFTLPDANKTPVTLSATRGQPVLLVFFPFAFSRVCGSEMDRLRDDLVDFTDAGVQVLAISCDTAQSLRAWADLNGYTFALLSDFWPHGSVARAYDVFFEPAGMALRGTFLLDASGVVRFAEVNGPGEPRDQSAWRRAVDALASVG